MTTKFSLALQYFPDQIDNSDSAIRRLMRWINNTRGLPEALAAAGYSRFQHSFSRRQVEIIVEYLGEP